MNEHMTITIERAGVEVVLRPVEDGITATRYVNGSRLSAPVKMSIEDAVALITADLRS